MYSSSTSDRRPSDIVWHEDNWSNEESRFLAFTLKGRGEADIYAAFNSHPFKVSQGP